MDWIADPPAEAGGNSRRMTGGAFGFFDGQAPNYGDLQNAGQPGGNLQSSRV